jgi:hypothetical protein
MRYSEAQFRCGKQDLNNGHCSISVKLVVCKDLNELKPIFPKSCM